MDPRDRLRSVGKRITDPVEPIAQRIAERAIDLVVNALDINALVARINLNAVLDHVDVNKVLAKVDLNEVLAKVDVNALLDRVDMNALLDRSGAIQELRSAPTASNVAGPRPVPAGWWVGPWRSTS
jgi:hypothetical protein